VIERERATICEDAPEEATCGLWVCETIEAGSVIHVCTGDHGETERHECGCGRRRRASLFELALEKGLEEVQAQLDETGRLLQAAVAKEGAA